MKLNDFKNKIGKLLIFDKKSLSLLEKDSNNLNANLKYWLKNSDLVTLKNGSYLFKDKYNKESNKDGYLEYIASQLLRPSYLSLEYVLNKYQMLSEPARALTSVSVKSTREFLNELGVWRYYFLPTKLFLGYKIKYFKNQPVAEASKAKALFDFLYLRFRRGQVATAESLENLRLNLENMEKKDWRELDSYFKLLSATRWQKLNKLLKKYVA
jgi:hypothetical protein